MTLLALTLRPMLLGAYYKLEGLHTYVAMCVPGTRVVLAGGAVRDAFHGTQVRDFDFMLEGIPESDRAAASRRVADRLGYHDVHEVPRLYLDSPLSVFRLTSTNDRDVDLIFTDSIDREIEQYPLGLSKIWLDSLGVHMHTDFIVDNMDKTLTFTSAATPEYRAKIIAKYPTFKPN